MAYKCRRERPEHVLCAAGSRPQRTPALGTGDNSILAAGGTRVTALPALVAGWAGPQLCISEERALAFKQGPGQAGVLCLCPSSPATAPSSLPPPLLSSRESARLSHLCPFEFLFPCLLCSAPNVPTRVPCILASLVLVFFFSRTFSSLFLFLSLLSSAASNGH